MNPTQVGRTHAGVRVLRANRLSPVGVVVVVLGRGDLIVVLVVTTTCRSQLLLESSVVGLRAVVLQPASNLRLLGLLTAAPHGVDPLQRRSGAGTDESVRPRCCGHGSCSPRYMVEGWFDHLSSEERREGEKSRDTRSR